MEKLTKFTLVFSLCAIANFSIAQIIDPKKAAETAATNKANSNIQSGVNAGVDKAESAIKGLFGKKKAATPAPAAAAPAPASAQPAAPAQTGSGFAAYNNYDFIPGDRIIFADDFTNDQLGEFPSHWNLGNGQGVINKKDNVAAFLITEGNYAHVSPRIKSASYLTDPFTVEFDVYTIGGYGPRLYFYDTNADATGANNVKAGVSFQDWSAATVSNEASQLSLTGKYPESIAGENFYNKWHHIAIAYKTDQLKIYVDQFRVLTVPHLDATPHALDIEGIGDANQPIIFSNFRLASGGGMNMLGKKFTDAKIITHGINFDIDQAIIKPESMGTLNMVAGVLKDNPELKFEIDGHTDNTGTPAHNITLSQQRADAVKSRLVAMGIDASRLSSKGFGDTKSISDNITPEGKANNRRVEFVKQ